MDERISTSLASLDKPDWHRHVSIVEEVLKPELQTIKGFIRELKEEVEGERKVKIEHLYQNFFDSGASDLDQRIEELTSELQRINDAAQLTPKYDLINAIESRVDLSAYPNLTIVQRVFLSPDSSTLMKQRLSAVLFKIGAQSLSQGNKSNAGQAGEGFARAILSSVGLISDQHYREQYKSQSGSDTDFAFPRVNDYQDSKLEVLVAVQMSTNDRARLASSELKRGVVRYVLTGNGLSASTKTLQDIGTQILSSYLDSNLKMVCYAPETERELKRISEMQRRTPSDTQLQIRKEYFSEFTITFENFAQKMSRFRVTP